jgi:hypothetical protein
MKVLQAKRARSGKRSAAPPDVHPSPTPAAATQQKKRPISELDTPTLPTHACKRYKAEHETVRRRNKLLETMQAQVLDLESKLHIASKSELCLSEDNDGLKARIPALSSGLGTLDSHNARAMLKRNGVVEYMKTPPLQQLEFCRREARKRARGEVERSRRGKVAEFRVNKAAKNRTERAEKARVAAEKQAAADAQMASVTVKLDEARIGSMKGAELDLQIEWHKRLGVLDPVTKKNIVCGMSKLKVQDKKYVLYGLIHRYKSGSKSQPGLFSM